ncbi:MAG: CHAD domain-containing protein, partial [Fulvivirga sp.]|nr:CHAD domain-containing protein [Fulvivirga sp.]
DPHHVIHEIRKNFKKIRAALRLIRDHVDFYKPENVFYRDLVILVSYIRDATSVIEASNLIYKQHSKELYKNAFSSWFSFLQKRRDKLAKKILPKENALEKIRKDLEKKLPQISDWDINIKHFDNIKPSIGRVYQRGKDAYEKVLETKDPADFHEWRKRVKYLMYQLEMLRRIWPDLLKTWEDELHKLSDCLGTDRDLFMLDNLIAGNEDKFKNDDNHYLLKSLIDEHRQQLQNHALLLGQRLYSLPTEHFSQLLESAWKAFDQELSPDIMPRKQLKK